MTRGEHLEWAKKRAFEIANGGDGVGAWTSFVSDLRKYDDLRDHPAIALGMMILAMDEFKVHETKKFIDGFN